MRSVKRYLILFPLFFACQMVLEPTDNEGILKNPVVNSYDQIRETKTQMRWNGFLAKYNVAPDTHLTHFMKSTSFLIQAYFKEKLPKIMDIESSTQNNTNLVIQLRKFYSEWEDLFGCKTNNIEFELNPFVTFDENELVYRFQQRKFGNTSCPAISQSFIKFALSKNGELKAIISTLIPDFEIKIPSGLNSLDISKMIAKTMGYEYEFQMDASSINFPSKHIFNSKDNFKVKDGFEIFSKYSEENLSIYCLKGIEYFWLENNIEYKCTIYYHPETAEIIYVKK